MEGTQRPKDAKKDRGPLCAFCAFASPPMKISYPGVGRPSFCGKPRMGRNAKARGSALGSVIQMQLSAVSAQ